MAAGAIARDVTIMTAPLMSICPSPRDAASPERPREVEWHRVDDGEIASGRGTGIRAQELEVEWKCRVKLNRRWLSRCRQVSRRRSLMRGQRTSGRRHWGDCLRELAK